MYDNKKECELVLMKYLYLRAECISNNPKKNYICLEEIFKLFNKDKIKNCLLLLKV